LAQPTTSFRDELASAGRGCFALLTGNRQAASFFDFSQRGLVGSFIAFLLANAVTAFGPQLLGLGLEPGLATRGLMMNGVLFVLQMALAYIVLRQLGRTDGFVPFLVADNWTTFFTAFLSLVLLVLGDGGGIAFFAVIVVVIIIDINIARLIVTLAPMQIAMFIVAQLVGASIGLLLFYGMLAPAGLPPAG
jgi:hypothetical protein